LGFQLLATYVYNSTLYLATYSRQFYTHDPTPFVLFHDVIDLIIIIIFLCISVFFMFGWPCISIQSCKEKPRCTTYS